MTGLYQIIQLQNNNFSIVEGILSAHFLFELCFSNTWTENRNVSDIVIC
jgi:hypothetical protein